MRTGRPKVALILTDDERQRLESLAHRSRSAPQVARRARIMTCCQADTPLASFEVSVAPTRGGWVLDDEQWK